MYPAHNTWSYKWSPSGNSSALAMASPALLQAIYIELLDQNLRGHGNTAKGVKSLGPQAAC